MKKLLFISVIFLIVSSFTLKDTYVYICKSTNSTKYHLNEYCKGLNNCKHKIEKVTLKNAEKRGRTLCKWED